MGPDGSVTLQYAQAYGVDMPTAFRRLELQRYGGGLVARAQAALGKSYGGVWFDNTVGRFRIAVASRPGQTDVATDTARGVAAELQIDGDTDVVPVTYGTDELAAAQGATNEQLADLMTSQLISTTIDPAANAVKVRLSSSASPADAERVREVAKAASAPTVVETTSKENLAAVSSACSFPNCDRPLRGGVRLTSGGSGCSAGYLAIQNNTGNRYMLTAGHCAHTGTWSATHMTTGTPRSIGVIDHYVWDSGGDYARIAATGSFWDTSPWQAQSTFWGINETYPTLYAGWSYPGIFGCRTGGYSSAQCGTVTESGTTQSYDGVTVNGLFRVSACANLGDSGGPFMADYWAVGIQNAVSGGQCNTGGGTTLYSEVMNAQIRMNAQLAVGP